MIYHPCPECGANLDPGERCECQREISLPELLAIRDAHINDGPDATINMIWAGYRLGYEKAAQDAPTSQSDNSRAKGPTSQVNSTTVAGGLQEGGFKC